MESPSSSTSLPGPKFRLAGLISASVALLLASGCAKNFPSQTPEPPMAEVTEPSESDRAEFEGKHSSAESDSGDVDLREPFKPKVDLRDPFPDSESSKK